MSAAKETSAPQQIYLVAAVVGAIVPWIALGGFLHMPEPSPALFIASMFSNPVDSAISLDLLISGLIFLFWMRQEGRRLGMTRLWIYVPATFLVGLSFGLPLFLYYRSRHLATAPQTLTARMDYD